MYYNKAVHALIAAGIFFLLLTLSVPAFSQNGKMYWTSRYNNDIHRANLDGTNVELVVPVDGHSFGLALDIAAGKMYWTEVGAGDNPNRIRRANLDGTGIEDLIMGAYAYGLALDTAGGKTYWVNSYPDRKIQRANLDGTGIEDLFTFGTSIGLSGIALDVAAGKMYWTYWDPSSSDTPGKIQRANLDATNVEDVVTGLYRPAALALDITSNKVYWTDNYYLGKKIQRANLNGTNVEDVVLLAGDSYGIALDVAAGKMYWTLYSSQKIHRANLDGSGIEDLVTNTTYPMFIALDLSSPIMSVAIDIKPGSAPNSINPNSKGVIPVAILTTPSFDATTVDPLSVKFGPNGATESHGMGHIEDANGDGDMDLVLHFRTQDTGIQCGDTEASLTGQTYGGQAISGTDAIQTVGCGSAKALAETEAGIPEGYALLQNYPNPFNPETGIRFQLPEAGHVVVKIFNTVGEEIRTLVDAEYEAGYHRVRWDGKDKNGKPAASGVYLYQLRAGNFSQVKKMSLVR